MEEKISNCILSWCERRTEILPEERAVVLFGLEMGMESLLKTLGILGFGLLFQREAEFLVAFLVFGSLRLWAGGIHCKTSPGCFGFMLTACAAGVLF